MIPRHRIYVDRLAIDRNLSEGIDFPPIVIRGRRGAVKRARTVEIHGPARVVYDPAGLHDGTRVWIETDAAVTTTT